MLRHEDKMTLAHGLVDQLGSWTPRKVIYTSGATLPQGAHRDHACQMRKLQILVALFLEPRAVVSEHSHSKFRPELPVQHDCSAGSSGTSRPYSLQAKRCLGSQIPPKFTVRPLASRAATSQRINPPDTQLQGTAGLPAASAALAGAHAPLERETFRVV